MTVPRPSSTTARSLLSQQLPAALRELSREERVAALLDAAQALRAGRPVNPIAGKIIGAALYDWLIHGGNFAAHLRIVKRGSHQTYGRIAHMALQAQAANMEGDADETTSIAASHLTMKPVATDGRRIKK
jgi:hypothetical protein